MSCHALARILDRSHGLAKSSGAILCCLGTFAKMATGRVAFAFGFSEPAMPLNNGGASTLAASHRAGCTLNRSEVDMALAVCVNALMSQAPTRLLRESGMPSPSGRHRVCDTTLEGFVRVKGNGVIELRRSEDVLADWNRIRDVMQGSAVSRHGANGGLPGPGGLVQQRASGLTYKRNRLKEVQRLLRQPEEAVPGNLQIYIIQANCGTHKHPEVMDWIGRHRYISLHFTPTSASRLSPVERFVGPLPETRQQSGVHSVQGLQRSFKDYIRTCDENPRPWCGRTRQTRFPRRQVASGRRCLLRLHSHQYD